MRIVRDCYRSKVGFELDLEYRQCVYRQRGEGRLSEMLLSLQIGNGMDETL